MTIFSKIINGQIPCYKIAESEQFFAFLDINPAAPGHTLVVPKTETDRLFDLDDELLKAYLLFCKPIARAIKTVTGADRINILTLGFEVPHAHVHLLPMNDMQDAFTGKKKVELSADEMLQLQQQIVATIASF